MEDDGIEVRREAEEREPNTASISPVWRFIWRMRGGCLVRAVSGVKFFSLAIVRPPLDLVFYIISYILEGGKGFFRFFSVFSVEGQEDRERVRRG